MGFHLQKGREDHVTYFLKVLRLFFALLQFPAKLFQRTMTKERDSPCQHENGSGAAKFAHTFSFLSVLICSAVLVRVEIVNQRVDTVENSLSAEIRRHNADTSFHGFAERFKEEKKERYISGLDINDQDVKDFAACECVLKKIRCKFPNSESRNLIRY